MHRFHCPLFLLTSLVAAAASNQIVAQQRPAIDPGALVRKIQGEVQGPFPQESKRSSGIPHGEFLRATVDNSRIFPGTENAFEVYVPAEYDRAKPACLLLKLDGMSDYEASVLDNLIAAKEIPVTIGVGLHPGTVWKSSSRDQKRTPLRYNRSFEFDSVNDRFPDFVLDELLPAVQKLKTAAGQTIRLSPDGNDHAVMGGSTGGIGSFTLAWRRPDQFSRVYSAIGTFVSMRGGHEYPAFIRKTEPKPIRVFLEDGSNDAWNPLFGSWYEENLLMESALTFSGYDVAHAWGTHGHNGTPGQVILPDVMRWLWRDYPQPIKAGVSQNSTLREIAIPDENWERVEEPLPTVADLTADSNGDVYLSDGHSAISRLGVDGRPIVFLKQSGVAAEAFGADNALYAAIPSERRIIEVKSNGRSRTIARGIAARNLTVTHDGVLYASEPGADSEDPSRLWRITEGRRQLLDSGLSAASGIAFSPDRSLFFAAEKSGKWIYSFVVRPGGELADKQAFFWLHIDDIASSSGTEELAVDTHGNLYAATLLGIQVCDQNGRVRAILPLPAPGAAVRSLCFGGKHFDILYASNGTQIFRRRMNVPGVAPWSLPVAVPSQGPG